MRALSTVRTLLVGVLLASLLPMSPALADEGDPVVEVTPDNYGQFIAESAKRPVILEFGGPGCIPCEKLAPIVKKIAREDKGAWLLGMVNMAEHNEIAEKHKVDIAPTMVAIRNGLHIGRWNEVEPEEPLVRAWIKEQLAKDPNGGNLEMRDVTPANYDEVIAESKRRPVVFGFDGGKGLGQAEAYARSDMGSWLLGRVAADAGNDGIRKKHNVTATPELVMVRDGVEKARTTDFDDARLRAWLDKQLSNESPDIVDPNIVKVTAENWAKVKEESAKRVVFLDFWKHGCPPCEQLKPVIQRKAVEAKGKWLLGTVNYTNEQPIVKELGVDWLPTVIALKDGKEISRQVDYESPEKLQAFIDDALEQAQPPAPSVVDIVGQADFDKAMAESHKRLVVVNFGAEWCSWCHKIKGPLNELVTEDAGRWQHARVDVTRNLGLQMKYRVKALPTLIAFRDGKEVPGSRWTDENIDGNFKPRLRTWLDTQLDKG